MSLHDRIMEKIESVKDAEYLNCVPETLAYNQGIKQAAQIAREADELMAEMAAVLESASVGAVVIDYARDVLDKYDDWKENAK